MAMLTDDERRAKVRARAARRRENPEYREKLRARGRLRESTPEYKAWRSAYNAVKYYSLGDKEHRDKLRYARRERPVSRAKEIIGFAKFRAKKVGMEFSITLDDVLPKIVAGKCSVTGKSFDLGLPPEGRKTNPCAPSIDRIDGTRGYTKDNIQIVIWAYNAAKHENTDNELINFLRSAILFSDLADVA